MMVILQAILVANHLAVQFVNQLIDGGIHVLVGTFGKHIAAFDMDIAFGLLTAFFFGLVLNAQ